jgi:DMSO/TMAO reductase YedYZ molybdopterin-dependent catalytic subunit
MKRRALALIVALAWVLVFTACQSASPTPTATPAVLPTAAQPETTAILEVVGPAGSKTLTLDEIRALPAVTGWAGIKNSVGKITQPTLHKGVALEELFKLVGGAGPEYAIEVTAKDGFATSLSYDEGIKGNLITYDPISGNEIKIGDALQVIVAYERDGQPLPEESDGSLRLAVISPRNNQVTDGHWAVKWVVKIAVKRVAE